MIPVVYNNTEKLIIKVYFYHDQTKKSCFLPIDVFSWNKISEETSVCCGWFAPNIVASNSVTSNIMEAKIGEIWEYYSPTDTDPENRLNIKVKILGKPEIGVEVTFFSTSTDQRLKREKGGWLPISDKSIRKVKDVSFPPFLEKTFYNVTVYEMEKIIFSQRLNNICKNADGIWEGTKQNGEICRWHPRMSFDFYKY